MGHSKRRPQQMDQETVSRNRRLSHDEQSVRAPRRFLIDVEETLRLVLEQEDTNGDFQIGVVDAGPKLMSLGTASSNAYKSHDIRVSHKDFWRGKSLGLRAFLREPTCFPTSCKN
jgi:alpha,alpha-trehalase